MVKKKLFNRIEVNPQVMVGKPVIAGTRIPVYLILNLLAQGYTFKRILKAYPTLCQEDIEAALEFAGMRLEREESYFHA